MKTTGPKENNIDCFPRNSHQVTCYKAQGRKKDTLWKQTKNLLINYILEHEGIVGCVSLHTENRAMLLVGTWSQEKQE